MSDASAVGFDQFGPGADSDGLVEDGPEGVAPEPEASGEAVDTDGETGSGESTGNANAELHTVKVNGEEFEVTLEEALAGYQRQADYTRGKQELASVREQAEAFEAFRSKLHSDPQALIAELSEQFAGGASTQDDAASEPVELSETEALRRQVDQLMQEREDALLDRTLTELGNKYDGFDEQAVIDRAVEQGVTDISMLEGIWKQVAFDKQMGVMQAGQQAAQADAADDAQRQAAASEAGDTISDDGSAPAGQAPPPVFDSFEDSFKDAWLQAGGTPY